MPMTPEQEAAYRSFASRKAALKVIQRLMDAAQDLDASLGDCQQISQGLFNEVHALKEKVEQTAESLLVDRKET